MSVCFFVPGPGDGSGASGEEAAGDDGRDGDEQNARDAGQVALQAFWAKVMEDIRKVNGEDFKSQVLPLARIKKIMKLDEDVKMISAEAPMLFAKAAEIFIHELTLRAWVHTEDNKRRTLQRNDIAMAISNSDQFDFLIDIVPRNEVKMNKPREDPPKPNPSTDQVGYYLQLAQQHQQALQGGAGGAQQASAAASTPTPTPQPAAATQLVLQQHQPQIHHVQASSGNSGAGNQSQPVALIQNLMTPNGDVLPIQLTQAQLNMIRMQMQSNSSQPIIIQAQPPHHQPQIIQVSGNTGSAPAQGQSVFIQAVHPAPATAADD